MKRTTLLSGCMLLAVLLNGAVAQAAQITLTPIRDNTLYESTTVELSNGTGNYLFAGLTTNDGAEPPKIRRALMAFDIAGSVPPGSVILNATLTLNMSRTKVRDMQMDLFRMTSDWGEGASNAEGQEGTGIAAAPGDATWNYSFYPTTTWTTPGGDFAGTASASTLVDRTGFYSWGSNAQMVADVQSWLDTPANNYGWILLGPETERSAKRFDSRENGTTANRPSLMIEFTSSGPTISNWIATAGGSFNDNANWDTGLAPANPTDIAFLVNGETHDQTATLVSSVTMDDLTIDGGTHNMTLAIGPGISANVGDLSIGGRGGVAFDITSGSAGQISAGGAASLMGSIELAATGTPPAATETFALLTYGSRSGMFDTFTSSEIETGRTFSLHYNDSRVLAMAGEWAAASAQLTGDFDVPGDLLVSGAWSWDGLVIKHGAGELEVNLDGGFSSGPGAALAIVDGTVRFSGTNQTLSLQGLTYGDLGALSGDASLDGIQGWYGPVPEPGTLATLLLGACLLVGRTKAKGIAMKQLITPLTLTGAILMSTHASAQINEFTVNGNLTFDPGTILEIDITSTTQYDRLTVTGAFNADGTLDILLDPLAATPSAGDSYDILNFGSVAGTFAVINKPNLRPNGLYFNTQQVLLDGTVTVAILADLDADGDVDGVDLSAFFSNFTGPGAGPPTNPDTDLDGDGDVDGVDLSGAFSAFTGPLAPASVPEPSCIGLLGLGVLLTKRRNKSAANLDRYCSPA